MDQTLFSAINGAHVPVLDVIMAAASRAGYGAALWYALVLVGFAAKRTRAAGLRAMLALLLTQSTDLVAKPLVGRERPFHDASLGARVVDLRPDTLSFPSGHAGTSVAGATALSRLWPGASAVLWATAAVVTVSRVYVGVHYPSDIAAGALLGLACAWLVLGGQHPSTWAQPAAPATGAVDVA